MARKMGWKAEISNLMREFCFPKETTNRIIADTRAESHKGDTPEIKYERAWRKFKATLATM